MFTGLVEDLGTIVAMRPLPRGSGQRLTVAAPLLQEVMPLGASLAVDGACLTVVTARPGEVELEAGPETLERTVAGDYKPGHKVHLERALRVGDRLGGHFVSGHVDGVGTILQSAARGDSWDVTVQVPTPLLRYIVEKGAIAIDGVSLTVNQVDARGFSVSLVPHTQKMTLLASKTRGQRVNLEVDIIAKHVEKLAQGYLPGDGAGLTLEKLKEHGFV